jgi:hypothetical protein
MSRSLKNAFWMVVSFAIIALIFVVLPELSLRWFGPEIRPVGYGYVHPAGWARAAPYVMWTGDTNLDLEYIENDYYQNTSYRARIRTNNYGFRVDRDFGPNMRYERGSNERVVILTGGSAAFGVGATSNDTMISAVMQRILNESQSRYRYTVLNFGMGGWVAYQEFLALEMWGRAFQPDWIVSMSGSNDGKLPYFHRQGLPGTPNYWYGYQRTIDEIYYRQYRPTLYRSQIEEWLLSNSHLVRFITGGQPRIPAHGLQRTDRRQLTDSAAWYMHSLRASMSTCPTCRVIIATQPISNFDYNQIIVTDAELAAAESDERVHWYTYYISKLLRDTPAFIRDYPQVVAYRSLAFWEGVFPGDHGARPSAERLPFFNDDVHLNDRGQAEIARYFAGIILRVDAGETVPRLLDLPPDLQTDSEVPGEGIRVLVATYGGNCDAQRGNVTRRVALACNGSATCRFMVDIRQLGDPSPGCRKTADVTWTCGGGGELRSVMAPAEAGFGSVLELSCPTKRQ